MNDLVRTLSFLKNFGKLLGTSKWIILYGTLSYLYFIETKYSKMDQVKFVEDSH